MSYKEQINALIEEIVSGYKPQKIYLFGSYAKGNYNENSDFDLLIIKDTSKRKIERNREVRKCIKMYPSNGLDIFVYTPKELQEGLLQTVHIGKEAVNTGKLLYERV